MVQRSGNERDRWCLGNEAMFSKMNHLASLYLHVPIGKMSIENLQALQTIMNRVFCEIDRGEHRGTDVIEIYVGDDVSVFTTTKEMQ